LSLIAASDRAQVPNVLWEIRCSTEDDVGFHSAAHIELLSQHPAEKEVLFPPLTMLQVISGPMSEVRHEEETSTGAKYTRIVVTPTFI
jgi:hypothetical protein